jgi:hypothetical protein
MNENKIVLVAIAATGCSRCFFLDPTCNLDHGNVAIPSCDPQQREDGRLINWILESNLEDDDEVIE